MRLRRQHGNAKKIWRGATSNCSNFRGRKFLRGVDCNTKYFRNNTISFVLRNLDKIWRYAWKSPVKGFYYVLWVLWFYKTRKWLLSQANDLLGKKERNRQNFYVGQSLPEKRRRLTKKSTVDHGNQILARKSAVDKKVNGGRESQRLTRKS